MQQQQEQKQREQQPGGAGVDDRFNSSMGASGNTYAQQNNNAYAQQAYYYHDIGQQQQQQQQYNDSSYPPQAYQQLAYTGISASQPYWYAPYGEGNPNPAVQNGNAQEVNLALRERDVKTQRRKEANRESARRSKQRKKEESELLTTKAQELVNESKSLRSELEKIQKQADKLYNENMELRNQVAKAGGSLPPSPERIVPLKLPPPIELPASLLKDVGSSTVKKDQPTMSNGKGGNTKSQTEPVSTVPTILRVGDVLGEGDHVDLPSLLDSNVVNAEQFAPQLPLSPSPRPAGYTNLNTSGGDGVPGVTGEMLMSEAIVSFRESDGDPLFTSDDDMMLARALRNPQQYGGKSLGATAEDFSLIRQSDVGQGG